MLWYAVVCCVRIAQPRLQKLDGEKRNDERNKAGAAPDVSIVALRHERLG